MQAYSSITILLDGFIQNRSCSSCIKSFVGELSFQNYRYTEYKSKPETPYNPDIAFATVEDDAEEALAYSTVLKDAIDEARDLQHTPGNVGNSVYLAGKAKELENKYSSVSVKILGRSELKQEKMSAYLAVCSGSSNPPQMCIINYRGAGEQVAPVAIVGKGLTFDSGGLSLKPASGMDEMKYDKCGACVVIALMDAIARLGLKINVVGVAAFAENMPDADSYRPGDLITARNGLNIEVANTDADGKADDKSSSYVNEISTKDLEFGKEVTGNQGSKDKYFKFQLAISNAQANTTYSIDLTSAEASPTKTDATTYSSMTNPASFTTNDTGDATITFYLKDGQYIKIPGLPEGYGYTLTETEEDYASSATISAANGKGGFAYSDDVTGTNVSTDIKTGFTNDRKGIIPTGVIMTIAPFAIGICVFGAIIIFIICRRKRRNY